VAAQSLGGSIFAAIYAGAQAPPIVLLSRIAMHDRHEIVMLRASLRPAVADHTAIDVVIAPWLLLFIVSCARCRAARASVDAAHNYLGGGFFVACCAAFCCAAFCSFALCAR
jgi:hypothetical protein